MPLGGHMSETSSKTIKKQDSKDRFMFLFGSWVLFIGTIVLFFVATWLYQRMQQPKAYIELAAPKNTLTEEADSESKRNKKSAETKESKNPDKATKDSEASDDEKGQDKKSSSNAVNQLDIKPEEFEEGFRITIKANHPITNFVPSDSMLRENKIYFIDFFGNWEEPKIRSYEKMENDIVKKIRIGRPKHSDKKIRLALYLKKIQTPTIQESDEGLIITIKSLNKSVEHVKIAQKNDAKKPDKTGGQAQKTAETKDDAKKSDKAGEQAQKPAETKDDVKKSDKTGEQVQKSAETKDDVKKSDKAGEQAQKTAETKDDAKKSDKAGEQVQKSDNQIVDIKKGFFSLGSLKIIILTNPPIKDYKPPYVTDRKLYIEFKGKWEKPKRISYEPSNDIVKYIEINNESPDKTKLVFYLREDIQIPDIEATSQGLIITIDKLE